MYTEFFGLNEKPFSITPDPRYLYLSARHADALAHLVYGISESGGFIQLTGEVGTGKTTLIRTLLQQLPEKAEIALILNPQLSIIEFLHGICDELAITVPEASNARALIGILNTHLLGAHAEGRRVVLIVDEAQTLSPELLEQVRLLTNLETATQKLLQIILIGQPELRDLLQRREMRQIAQRVTGRYHLEPLGRAEAQSYITHRLRVAGCQQPLFDRGAVAELYRRSAGIPRLINVIADRALLAGYSRDQTRIDRSLVRQAAAEVFGAERSRFLRPFGLALAAALIIALIGTGLLLRDPKGPVAVAAAPTRGAQPLAQTTASASTASIDNPPTATAAASPNAEPALRDLLASLDTATSDDAFAELFAMWGARYDINRGQPCAQAIEQGLECISDTRGSLHGLRAINRAAVLTLRDSAGGQHDVLLTALDGGNAELRVGQDIVRTDISALSRAWFGEQTLLWRPPVKDATALKPGISAPAVVWLRRSLASIRGEPLGGDPSPVYDPGLEAEVRQYQRQRQLDVDGIVGVRTQIAMLSDLDLSNVPTLSRK